MTSPHRLSRLPLANAYAFRELFDGQEAGTVHRLFRCYDQALDDGFRRRAGPAPGKTLSRPFTRYAIRKAPRVEGASLQHEARPYNPV